MRVGVVRDDMGRGLHLDDLMPRNQYPYASQVAGQSRVLRKPTDAELADAVAGYPAPVFLLGSDTNAAVDTSVNDTLRIRASLNDAYTVIAVTAGAATAKTTIRDDLNTAFASGGLPFLASVVGTNQIQITSISPNVGPNALLDIDTFANGSTLNTPLGLADGATVTGTATTTLVSDIKTAAYPTAVTIDVSEATIVGANAVFANLSAGDKTALTAAVAELIAPYFVETGDVLNSFANGKMSVLRAATYRPDGDRAGYPTGIAIAAVEDDGSTPFTYP